MFTSSYLLILHYPSSPLLLLGNAQKSKDQAACSLCHCFSFYLARSSYLQFLDPEQHFRHCQQSSSGKAFAIQVVCGICSVILIARTLMSHFLSRSFVAILKLCLISCKDFDFVLLATLFSLVNFITLEGPTIHFHCQNLVVCSGYPEGS